MSYSSLQIYIGEIMREKILLTACLLFIVFSAQAEILWRCTTTNHDSRVWSAFGITKIIAVKESQTPCKATNNKKACPVDCFPPRGYWRCVAHDTVPESHDTNKKLKHGVWYWTSAYKQVAINGARDACIHNSAFGGCYVDPNACASSSSE